MRFEDVQVGDKVRLSTEIEVSGRNVTRIWGRDGTDYYCSNDYHKIELIERPKPKPYSLWYWLPCAEVLVYHDGKYTSLFDGNQYEEVQGGLEPFDPEVAR